MSDAYPNVTIQIYESQPLKACVVESLRMQCGVACSFTRIRELLVVDWRKNPSPKYLTRVLTECVREGLIVRDRPGWYCVPFDPEDIRSRGDLDIT